MILRIVFLIAAASTFHQSALAQVFLTGLAGASALSPSSVIRAVPPAASSYDPKVGPAVNVAAGYHGNDWVSAQLTYGWNRNLLTVRQLNGLSFSQSESRRTQSAVALEAMLYFRPRVNRLRPYLSAGPALVRFTNRTAAGLRVAVGIDILARHGWGVRYSFGETLTSNPFAKALTPPATGRLMNFQNLFGVVKTF